MNGEALLTVLVAGIYPALGGLYWMHIRTVRAVDCLRTAHLLRHPEDAEAVPSCGGSE